MVVGVYMVYNGCCGFGWLGVFESGEYEDVLVYGCVLCECGVVIVCRWLVLRWISLCVMFEIEWLCCVVSCLSLLCFIGVSFM